MSLAFQQFFEEQTDIHFIFFMSFFAKAGADDLHVEHLDSHFLWSSIDGGRLLRRIGVVPGLLVDVHVLLRCSFLLCGHPKRLYRPRRHEPKLISSATPGILFENSRYIALCQDMTWITWNSQAHWHKRQCAASSGMVQRSRFMTGSDT